MVNYPEQKCNCHPGAEAALRDLGGRLIRAQEEERSRIAREFHDDLSQRLALLSMELGQLSRKIPARQSDLRSRIQDAWAKAQEISVEVHRISYQLHPSKLEHLGLAPALKSFCDELSERHDVRVTFRNRGVPAALPKDVALCVFRIAQEALHNVVRHSGAPEARVVLDMVGRAVRLCVSDSGAGFDVEAVARKEGLGLVSMTERLRLVGGELTIRSRPSRGTQIDARVPLAEAVADFETAAGGGRRAGRPSLPPAFTHSVDFATSFQPGRNSPDR